MEKSKINHENTGLFNAEGEELSISDVLNILSTSINRVEIIDERGRRYVDWRPTNKVELQIQDDGRTLKVFISQVNYEKPESDGK